MERDARIEEELFPFYVLDALTDEERAEVEQYVAANPEARLRLAELEEAALDLFSSAAPVTPSPAVKARLMSRVEAEVPATASLRPTPPAKTAVKPRQRPRWPWLPVVGFVAAALALIIAGGYILSLTRQVGELKSTVTGLEATVGDLQGDIGSLQTQNEALRDELSAREDQLAALLSPGAITLALGDISGDHPDAVGALTIDPQGGAANLSVANLPPLDESQTYQAWLIVEGAPVSAGTFDVDQGGAGSHAIPDASPGTFDAVGVSIEPAGGSEQPTPNQIILLAGFSS
jgi:anti-sigma-K factor RskA